MLLSIEIYKQVCKIHCYFVITASVFHCLEKRGKICLSALHWKASLYPLCLCLNHKIQILLLPIYSPMLQCFKPAPSNVLNYGHTQSTIWGRINLVNTKDVLEKLFLVIWNPNLDTISVYIQRSDGKITSLESGDMVATRPMPWISSHVIPFTLEPREQIQLLFKSHTEVGYQLIPISFLIQSSLDQISHIKSVIHGFLIGICIALLLYTTMLFITLNDITYAYYAAYLTTAIVIISGLTGMGMTTFLDA